MPHHVELVESAKEAIGKVGDDMSVNKETTIASLEELQTDIETRIDALNKELDVEEEEMLEDDEDDDTDWEDDDFEDDEDL